MRKLLSIGGGVLLILSLLTSSATAKSYPETSICISSANDLSERLAADNDFQIFITSASQISDLTKTTSGFNLLKEYFQQNIFVENKRV